MLNGHEAAPDQLSLKRILTDGSVLSAVQGSIIVASLYYNPEIWYDDYPDEIKAKFGPMSAAAKKQRLIVAIPFLVSMLGLPSYSNLKLKRENHGRLSFKNGFINAYAVYTLFGLFDLLVIDYLLLIRLRPRFAVLPGTDDLHYANDFRYHLNGFLKGLGFGMIPSLIIAYLTSRSWKRR